jgi:hypothetical protein
LSQRNESIGRQYTSLMLRLACAARSARHCVGYPLHAVDKRRPTCRAGLQSAVLAPSFWPDRSEMEVKLALGTWEKLGNNTTQTPGKTGEQGRPVSRTNQQDRRPGPVCKTSITGSNPGRASNSNLFRLNLLPGLRPDAHSPHSVKWSCLWSRSDVDVGRCGFVEGRQADGLRWQPCDNVTFQQPRRRV